MGLWTMVGNVDGLECAALVDSVTMRPLNLPLFDDADEAEAFIDFARANGVQDGDVRRLDDDKMNALHSRWLASGNDVRDDGIVAYDDAEVSP